MPNYVSNHLSLKGPKDEVKKCLEFILSEREDGGTELDFNKIISMPIELQIESHSTGHLFHYLMFGYGNDLPVEDCQNYLRQLTDSAKREGFELALKYNRNVTIYGYPTWCEWGWSNWGTKWGALDTYVNGQEISFETAWGVPTRVIIKLSELFSNIVFRLKYSSETGDDDRGVLVFETGSYSMFSPEDLQTYSLMEWYKNYFPKSTLAKKVIDKRLEYALSD